MQEGLEDDTKVPFSVIWNVIETHLRNTPNHSQPTGSITFSSVQELRGLPYKVIALCGFDEASGFPGNSSHSEFDLMGVDKLKRRADRDSREDSFSCQKESDHFLYGRDRSCHGNKLFKCHSEL